jgi:hypothetical protein
LLTFRVQGDFRPGQPDTNPHWYVQNLWDFALTVTGQDHARGQMIAQPLLIQLRTMAARLATSSSGRSPRRSPGSTPLTRSPSFSPRKESPRRRCGSPTGRIPATRTRYWPSCGGGARRAAG